MHKYIICLGSNYNREANLLLARNELERLFPSIYFTKEIDTEPVSLKIPLHFLNQLAVFFSAEGEEYVNRKIKEIEIISGRSTSSDKLKEKICLDIDLLACDNKILKPEDWERSYMKKLLLLLPSSILK